MISAYTCKNYLEIKYKLIFQYTIIFNSFQKVNIAADVAVLFCFV